MKRNDLLAAAALGGLTAVLAYLAAPLEHACQELTWSHHRVTAIALTVAFILAPVGIVSIAHRLSHRALDRMERRALSGVGREWLDSGVQGMKAWAILDAAVYVTRAVRPNPGWHLWATMATALDECRSPVALGLVFVVSAFLFAAWRKSRAERRTEQPSWRGVLVRAALLSTLLGAFRFAAEHGNALWGLADYPMVMRLVDGALNLSPVWVTAGAVIVANRLSSRRATCWPGAVRLGLIAGVAGALWGWVAALLALTSVGTVGTAVALFATSATVLTLFELERD